MYVFISANSGWKGFENLWKVFAHFEEKKKKSQNSKQSFGLNFVDCGKKKLLSSLLTKRKIMISRQVTFW